MTQVTPLPAWPELRDLVTEGRTAELADRVIALDEAERPEVARRLPAFRKELRSLAGRAASERWESLDEGESMSWDETIPGVFAGFGMSLRIVGAGTIAGPAAAATWLGRREFDPRWSAPQDPADLVRVILSRPAGWRADVVGRLAGRIRTSGDTLLPLVLALLRACGGVPAEHDPLVVGWLSAGVVADDPLLAPLLPRIFEAEGVGRALREERLEPAPSPWLSRMRELLASGQVSRGELLDGCVSRFLRGGDAVDLRFFVRLHTLIDPAPQEAAGRARDYLRLLPSAPGTVAELALTQVRRTGPHDPAEVAEAIGALTFRPEAKLARAGLSWLEEEVRQAPGRAADLAPALATAFAHASYEVQGRAAALALRHAAAFGVCPGIGAAEISDAIPMLPGALGARVAAVFGGEAAPEETPEPFTPAALPAVAAPGPFPAAGPVTETPYRWREYERWLADFVEQAGKDRAALRGQLASAFRVADPYLYEMQPWRGPGWWISALATEVIAPGTDPGVPDPEPVDPWEGASFSVRVMPISAEEALEDAETEPADSGGGASEAEPSGSGDGVSEAGPSGSGGDASEDDEDDEEGEPQRAFGELPEHVREEIFQQLQEIGVAGERIAAMRDGLPLPPPDPSEPDFRVWISYMGSRPLFGKPEPPGPGVELRRRRRLPEPQVMSPPDMFLLHRLSEVYVALREGTLPPLLLATPTVTNGRLDPGVLVDRLETCAAAGVEPLAADLQQALLRLPRGAHPDAAERAARVGSQAAAQVAAWLAGGGLPDPEAGLKWGYMEGATDYLFEEREPSPGVGHVRLVPVLRAEPTGHDLIDELLREPSSWRSDGHGESMDWWPAVLPSHREVVAVNYLPHLLYQWNHAGVYPPYLEALCQADGPVGDATAIILAYFLSTDAERGVPLLLRMAAKGDLPAAAVGRQLTHLIRRAGHQPRPVVAALAVAAREGAYEQVWEILRAMLPALLPGEGERPNITHTEAVTLAADVATWAKAGGDVPATVSAYAAGKRTSRFARECRRLRTQLT
ncbi:DUF6493 family protein [Nonomuraea jabiensis]|uniref:Secreted protein n=1 Tax=Nonomuraea jabiensis TaxID=882448 RepID=A0A7W9GB13_9ACTN|nr:DUF6493 family protein [Nonomuraea jabiensis]MBB5780351.1 hypothetical protein [Nonomuraea jabiensis]